MEAEKSHDLPSASWTPRIPSGVIQSEPFWRPENHGSLWCKSQLEGRRRWNEISQPNQWGRKKGSNFFPPLLSYSDLQRIEWCPILLGRAIYFAESTNPNANLNQKHLHRHTQKQCLIWALWLLGLTRKINHHNTNSIFPNLGYSWRFSSVPHFSLLKCR